VPCASHLALEHLDELAADDLALRFRIGDAGQVAEELLFGVDADDLHAEVLGEHVHDHLAFVEAQQAVVDEHAGQLIADRAVDQRGGDARIDAARQAEDHFIAADLGADLLDRLGDIVGHVPVRLAAADLVHEAAEDGLALLGVRDFGVELHAVEAALFIRHRGDRAARRVAHQLEAGRHVQHLVAVAHPHLEHAVALVGDEVGDAVQQGRVAARAHLGVTEFAQQAVLDLAAELGRHRLHAVANAQHGHSEFEHGLRRARGVAFERGAVAARQDHAGGTVVAHELVGHVVGKHFGEHTGVAHAARDELGDLGAEIENEDFRVHK
jgi:hypothetical protein